MRPNAVTVDSEAQEKISDMKYTVNSLISRLQELVEKAPQIGDAIVGICLVDEDNTRWMRSAYDLDVDEEGLCDDTFFISEVDDREYDEDE